MRLALLLGLTFPILAFSLLACKALPHNDKIMQTLPIEVTYRERIRLPADSELTVTLEDVSRMDIASTIITSKQRRLNGSPPYPIELQFRKESLMERGRYTLSAKIRHNKQLLFTSTEHLDPREHTERPIIMVLQATGQSTLSLSPNGKH